MHACMHAYIHAYIKNSVDAPNKWARSDSGLAVTVAVRYRGLISSVPFLQHDLATGSHRGMIVAVTGCVTATGSAAAVGSWQWQDLLRRPDCARAGFVAESRGNQQGPL